MDPTPVDIRVSKNPVESACLHASRRPPTGLHLTAPLVRRQPRGELSAHKRRHRLRRDPFPKANSDFYWRPLGLAFHHSSLQPPSLVDYPTAYYSHNGSARMLKQHSARCLPLSKLVVSLSRFQGRQCLFLRQLPLKKPEIDVHARSSTFVVVYSFCSKFSLAFLSLLLRRFMIMSMLSSNTLSCGEQRRSPFWVTGHRKCPFISDSIALQLRRSDATNAPTALRGLITFKVPQIAPSASRVTH